MNLVWTYKDFIHNDLEKRQKITTFYKTSITKAKKLNYLTEIYTNHTEFDTLIDISHFTNHESLFWDEFKFIPLANRYDDYILIDGDVFIHKKFPKLDKYDVYFDTFETGRRNYETIYKEEVDKLDSLGIGQVIEEWETDVYDIACCGILYFKDKEFQKLYYTKWKIFRDFVSDNIKYLRANYCTVVGAQYLLTLLIKYHNKSHYYFTNKLREPCEYYVHHAGKEKFSNEKLEFDILI